jgi:DNA-binding NarL/FixJ family response regulator
MLQPAEPKAKLLFLDDHRVILDGLAMLTGSEYEVRAVDTVPEFEAFLDSFQPDLAFIDVQLPNQDGFDVARSVLAKNPQQKIAFLSAHLDPRMLRRAEELGAVGYISKRTSGDELLAATRTMLTGGTYLPADAEEETPAEVPLTDRQKQVLRLIALGYSAKDIANELNISVRTAEFHRAEIMERLKLHSTALMTRYAIAHGIA